MAKLDIKAEVKNSDGSHFYSESHSWSNLDDGTLDWFKKKMDHMAAFGKSVVGKKEDDANLSATLSASIDGVAQPEHSYTGISRVALSKFEREFQKIGDELISMGEKRASDKAKKK